nr:unnamed protein product [Haemonchus contortus]
MGWQGVYSRGTGSGNDYWKQFYQGTSGIISDLDFDRFEEWVDSKTVKTYEPRVFQVSDESGEMKIEEIANYTQESLDGDDVMILDATNRIYVWVGEGANQNEKKNATNTAEHPVLEEKVGLYQPYKYKLRTLGY